MDDQVAQVKQKTEIVSLIGEYLDLKKAGRNYKALCPFHSEKTPSFMVSPELQIFKCFGCEKGGDVFSFLQSYESMDFPEALKFLAERAGVKLTYRKFAQSSEKERLYEINSLATKFYQYVLLKHPQGRQALSYLTKERKLKLETMRTFQLGFSPPLSSAIKKFLVEKKKFKAQDLVTAGILYSREGVGFDRFAGRIIFPLTDHRGNIIGFAGRVLPSGEKSPSGRNLAKYINSPETPVYHKSDILYGLNLTRNEIKSKKCAIVVEGELDLLSSWQVGVKNIVALKGSAFTQVQAKLLSRFTDQVILALDTDFAGDMAARRGIVMAEKEGLVVKVARLGVYKDPDEIAQQAPEKYQKALANPVGVWDFIIDSIFEGQDVKTGVGKTALSRELVPVLASITDSIVQAHYVEVVAKKMDVPASAVAEQITKFSQTEGRKPAEISFSSEIKTKSRRQILEERLMTLAFQSTPNLLLKKEVGLLMTTPLVKKLLGEFKKYSQCQPEFKPSEFAKTLPQELEDGFVTMFLKDVREDYDHDQKDLDLKLLSAYRYNSSKADAKKEWQLLLTELQILQIKEKLENCAEKIKQLEKAGIKDKLKRKKTEFARLTEELVKLKERE